jgi:c-di-GMP-binding flagellar brake protein YcgR
MTIERRRTANDRRRASRVAATFAVKNSAGGRIQLCQAEDIGPGGMTIRRPRDVSYLPSTPVALCFALPGTRDEISAEGVIVNDTKAGTFRRTGVRFIAIRPEHQQLIASFCRVAPAARAARVGVRSR